jgi:hypothetical protein
MLNTPILNESSSRTYQAISLFNKDIAVVVSARNSDLEERIEASQVNLWHRDKWTSMDIQMSSIAVTTWATKVLMSCYISHDGIALTNDGANDIHADAIDSTDAGPSELVQMKAVRHIDNSLIAVGMARLAYKKTLPDGKWIKIDNGLFVPREQRTTAVGLNDVVSDGNGGLLAVGYKGEIWHMTSNGSWKQESSPTFEYLSSISKNPNKDEFTIVGLKGVIIKGSLKVGWSLLETTQKVNFWSITYFKDTVFVASDSGLFKVDNDEVKEVDFGSSNSITTRFLDSCSDSIWSVGDNHIFSSQDGEEWIEIPNP